MQNDQIYSEINNLISTTVDLNMMNDELDLLEESLYKTGNDNFELVLSEKVREEFQLLIKKAIDIEKGDREAVFKKVREHLTEIKLLELTLALDPSKKSLDKIIAWLREATNQKI